VCVCVCVLSTKGAYRVCVTAPPQSAANSFRIKGEACKIDGRSCFQHHGPTSNGTVLHTLQLIKPEKKCHCVPKIRDSSLIVKLQEITKTST
jgi:hypothetical protein